MAKTTRKAALQILRAAGADNNRPQWLRVYVENRISLAAANEAWQQGRNLARFVEQRDAIEAAAP